MEALRTSYCLAALCIHMFKNPCARTHTNKLEQTCRERMPGPFGSAAAALPKICWVGPTRITNKSQITQQKKISNRLETGSLTNPHSAAVGMPLLLADGGVPGAVAARLFRLNGFPGMWIFISSKAGRWVTSITATLAWSPGADQPRVITKAHPPPVKLHPRSPDSFS